jgi:acid phosphatase type 7
MLKQSIMRIVRLLSVLVMGWLLAGADMQIAQASPTLATAGTKIFVPFVKSIGAPSTGAADPVVIATGDIARCGASGDLKTAAIIKKNPTATVLPLGDNAYENGAPLDYANCYNPAWGPFLNRTKPVPGNHDYLTPGAAGYFGYFGAAAGTPGKGYYSYNLGSWHLIAINSSCGDAGGCGSGSPQEKWLRADLAANKSMCTLAYWHHPYYSSPATGGTGATPGMATIFEDLYKAGAEIVLSGHVHAYERFAPQNDFAGVDSARGVVQFVVGTGGSNFTPLLQPAAANLLVSEDTVFGVLKLTLHPTSYTYQFIPISGKFTDTGTVNCH